METVAENSFTVTQDIFYEGMLKVVGDEYGGFAKKAVIFIAVAWAALAAFTVWKGGSIVLALIELVTLGVAALWIGVIVPRGKAKRGWKALQNRCGEDLGRTTLFYDDCLMVVNAAGEKTVNYENVRKRLETKRLLILIDDNHVGIMVALDGFTKGDKATVLAKLDEWSL